MVMGPAETSAVIAPVAVKVLMVADAAALTVISHVFAVHWTVPLKSMESAVALTPPVALAAIEPAASRVISVAAVR